VIKQLQKEGCPVVAPDNPLRGLPTDAPYLVSVLKSVKGLVILHRVAARLFPFAGGPSDGEPSRSRRRAVFERRRCRWLGQARQGVAQSGA